MSLYLRIGARYRHSYNRKLTEDRAGTVLQHRRMTSMIVLFTNYNSLTQKTDCIIGREICLR